MLSGAGTVPEDEYQDDESSHPSSFSAIMFVKDEHV